MVSIRKKVHEQTLFRGQIAGYGYASDPEANQQRELVEAFSKHLGTARGRQLKRVQSFADQDGVSRKDIENIREAIEPSCRPTFYFGAHNQAAVQLHKALGTVLDSMEEH